MVRTLDVLRLAVLRERTERHVRQSAAHPRQCADWLEAHQRVHNLRRKPDKTTKVQSSISPRVSHFHFDGMKDGPGGHVCAAAKV